MAVARTRAAAAITAVADPVDHRGAWSEQVNGFGRNPGDLLMFKYVPDSLPPGAPLVVALHGCNQSATAFDDESGWTEMADRLRFAVLLAEHALF